MRWREATRELFLKITVKCNCRALVSAMAGLKRAAPSIETSDDVPLFASKNVDSCDKRRIQVLTARDRVEDSDDDVPVFKPYIDRSQDDDTENLRLFFADISDAWGK
jgi:hypothetical protein